MTFQLKFAAEADANLADLENDRSQIAELRAVRKCLAYLESNPKHPSLQTHEFHSIKGPRGEKVFEAYAQNRTPNAFRVLWRYGPGKRIITIMAIFPHP